MRYAVGISTSVSAARAVLTFRRRGYCLVCDDLFQAFRNHAVDFSSVAFYHGRRGDRVLNNATRLLGRKIDAN
jgi:hypothetical protein